MSVKFVNNVLVPAWILIFGLYLLAAPPLGVWPNIWLFIVGGFLVPTLMVMPRHVSWRSVWCLPDRD